MTGNQLGRIVSDFDVRGSRSRRPTDARIDGWCAGTISRGLHNAFSGELPEELGNLIYLGSLVIANNNFSGELPQSLTGLTNLTYFDFGASGAEPPTDPAFQDWLGSVPSVSGLDSTMSLGSVSGSW